MQHQGHSKHAVKNRVRRCHHRRANQGDEGSGKRALKGPVVRTMHLARCWELGRVIDGAYTWSSNEICKLIKTKRLAFDESCREIQPMSLPTFPCEYPGSLHPSCGSACDGLAAFLTCSVSSLVSQPLNLKAVRSGRLTGMEGAQPSYSAA